jgi:hypothetical protein
MEAAIAEAHAGSHGDDIAWLLWAAKTLDHANAVTVLQISLEKTPQRPVGGDNFYG